MGARAAVERLLGGALPEHSFEVGSGRNSRPRARIHRRERRQSDDHSALSAHLQAVAWQDFIPEPALTGVLARSSTCTDVDPWPVVGCEVKI
jgi:hypothetical protein